MILALIVYPLNTNHLFTVETQIYSIRLFVCICRMWFACEK